MTITPSITIFTAAGRYLGCVESADVCVQIADRFLFAFNRHYYVVVAGIVGKINSHYFSW